MVTTLSRISSELPIQRLSAYLHTPLYRNGYALVLSSAGTSVLGIVYWVVAARIYTPQVVGSNSAAISALMFLAGVAQLNLMSALVRFVPGAGRATAPFVAFTYVIALVVGTAVSLVFVTFVGTWAPTLSFLGSSLGLASWFTLSTALWGIFVLQDSVLTGLRQASWVPIENLVFSIAKIGLLMAFVPLLPEHGIFGSWTAAVVASVIPINVVIFRRLIPRHVSATQDRRVSFVPTQILAFVPGDYIGSLCWLASTTLLPILVSQMTDAATVAYFYLAWQIAFWLHTVSPNMGSSLIVEAARDDTMLLVYSRRIFAHTFLIVGTGVLGVWLGAPVILGIFGSDYAAEGATTLRLLALGALPNVIISLAVSMARAQRRIRILVAWLALQCVLVLTLSYAFLPVWGITGVGIAWLSGQMIVAAAVLLTQLRQLWLPSSSRPR